MSNNILESLGPSVDSILGIRDSIGAVIRPVFLLTRTWFKDKELTRPSSHPEGYAKDSAVQILPSPSMKDFSQSIGLREGGAIKAGDIILRGISKYRYVESDLDGTSPSMNIEKLYLIGSKVFQVISVTEKYLTWDVQVRELTNQTRY